MLSIEAEKSKLFVVRRIHNGATAVAIIMVKQTNGALCRITHTHICLDDLFLNAATEREKLIH